MPDRDGLTKEQKQIAKLELAQAKRRGNEDSTIDFDNGERPLNTYDIDLLPTKYSGDDIVNNPNPGGLQQGRPWT